MSDQSIASWIRQPASIILIIILVVMLLMMMDQSRQQSGPAGPASASVSSFVPAPAKAVTLPEDLSAQAPGAMVSSKMGGELPKIVQRLGTLSPKPVPAAAPGRLTAPDLSSLLGRFEDKVKAEPDNINNRLLLAQTYNELGLADKALDEVRTAARRFPDHARAKLVLASILSKRNGEEGLKEAVGLLKSLRANRDVKQYLVEMYLGDTWIRLGDHKSAVDSWKLALQGMPVSDNRRAKIEKGIADISSNKPGS